VPSPSWREVSWAMANWSPVTILTFTPICFCARDSCFGLLAGRIEHWQHTNKLPLILLIRSSHAQGRKPRPANSLTAFSMAGFTSPALVDISRITCGAPLATKELFSVRSFNSSFGALMHRIERLEMDYLKGL